MPVNDISGERYGRLTPTALVDIHPRRGARWQCACECGGEKIAFANALRTGHVQSCGCLRRDFLAMQAVYIGKRNTTHGLSKTPEFRVWQGMKDRCHNPRSHAYCDYGARGIVVCDRWRESFAAFYEDMGERPPGTSLDRIDNNGCYEPGNCRWATASEQRRNRRPAGAGRRTAH